MDRLVIDETTNTLVKIKASMIWQRIEYLVIPHWHNGKQIDNIGPHCFDGIEIDLVCIEEGVKKLEDSAFENARVDIVKLPRGLKIGKKCFANCTLSEILLPRDLNAIKDDTFRGCKNLKFVDAYFGVNTVGRSAFAFCEELEEVQFNRLKSVGSYAFMSCPNLRRANLGSNVHKMGEHIFKFCSSLKTLKISGTFDEIPENTFFYAGALSELILDTKAETLLIYPHSFDTTGLEEITFLSNVEPICYKFSLPDDTTIRAYDGSKAQLALAYYYPFYML